MSCLTGCGCRPNVEVDARLLPEDRKFDRARRISTLAGIIIALAGVVLIAVAFKGVVHPAIGCSLFVASFISVCINGCIDGCHQKMLTQEGRGTLAGLYTPPQETP